MILSTVSVNIKSTDHKLCLMLLGKFVHIRKHLWFCPVIRIQKINIFSLCNINGCVSRAWCTSVFFMNHPDSVIFFRIPVTDFSASVRRSIINDQKFKLGKGLCENTLYGLSHIFFYFIHRHNDADFNVAHHRLLWRLI